MHTAHRSHSSWALLHLFPDLLTFTLLPVTKAINSFSWEEPLVAEGKELPDLIWFRGRKAATGISSAASAGRKPGVILGQEGRDSCLSYNLTVTSFTAARFLSFLVILLNGRMQLILQYLSPAPLTTKQSWRIESFILPLRGCFLSHSGH